MRGYLPTKGLGAFWGPKNPAFVGWIFFFVMKFKQFFRVYEYAIVAWVVITLVAVGALMGNGNQLPAQQETLAPFLAPSETVVLKQKEPEKKVVAVSEVSVPVPAATLQAKLQILENSYTLDIQKEHSAYELMRVAQEQGLITFGAKGYSGMGFFIESINGVSNDNRKGTYWIYYINGKKAQLGVSSYIVQPEDIIKWNYEHDENK